MSHLETLFNMMRISDSVMVPYDLSAALVNSLQNNAAMVHRASAVEWIVKIMSKDSPELRDTSVRIFDSFVAHSFAESPEILFDACWTVFAAAASMILASKLLHSGSYIKASQFTKFTTEDILFFEKMIIMNIGGKLSPHATPSCFLENLVPLCEDLVCPTILMNRANALVGEFFEDPNSLLFAPSTVAIAAIIVSLSALNVCGTAFINRLPDFFLFASDNLPFFQPAEFKDDYLDCQRCVKALEQLPSIRDHIKAISPVGVNNANVLG